MVKLEFKSHLNSNRVELVWKGEREKRSQPAAPFFSFSPRPIPLARPTSAAPCFYRPTSAHIGCLAPPVPRPSSFHIGRSPFPIGRSPLPSASPSRAFFPLFLALDPTWQRPLPLSVLPPQTAGLPRSPASPSAGPARRDPPVSLSPPRGRRLQP
jgi:hypothetical protein